VTIKDAKGAATSITLGTESGGLVAARVGADDAVYLLPKAVADALAPVADSLKPAAPAAAPEPAAVVIPVPAVEAAPAPAGGAQ
jgi:hypothetical protein